MPLTRPRELFVSIVISARLPKGSWMGATSYPFYPLVEQRRARRVGMHGVVRVDGGDGIYRLCAQLPPPGLPLCFD
jgi:hypothetical protein